MKTSRAIVVTTIATLTPLVGAAQASAETAYPAAAFTDSVGVNTKLAAPQTAYYNKNYGDRQNARESGGTAAPQVKKVLAALGVKHIRYDVCPTSSFNCVRGNQTAQMLFDDLGIRTLDDYYGTSKKAIDALATPSGIQAEVDAELAVAAQYSGDGVAGPVEALEGPNEFDRHNARYPDWAARVSHAQALAVDAINGGSQASRLSPLTLLPLPLGVASNNLGATNTLVGWKGDSTFRPWSADPIDAANQHTYGYADCPENLVQGAAVNASCASVSMPKIQCPVAGNPIWLNCANLVAGPSKPVWVTETGYTTSIDSLEGVRNDVAAAYLPRLLLEAWRQQADPGRRQWARTYLYELLDSREGRYCGSWTCSGDRESGHGLAGTTYQLKHQGRALARLMSLLSDPGAPTVGAGVESDVAVAPADQSQVRRLLFRKSNGQQVLAIWRPVKLWKNGTRNWWGGVDRGRAIAEGEPVNTTITLPTAQPVAIDRTSLSATSTETRAASTTHVVPARGDVTLITIG